MRSDTNTIIGALRVLAWDIETDDGVINACLHEAADLIDELNRCWHKADTPPASGVAVLAVVSDEQHPVVIRAMYASPYTLKPSPDYEDDCDYDESADAYYCHEGWYEYNCYDDVHRRVSGEVTHWMPLPDPPRR